MNYHHLLYFWTVASCGSITAASRRLRLAPQTLSTQIRALEDSVGQQLFERNGRRLDLTEAGRLAKQYADEIFALGSELHEVLRDGTSGARVRIGVEDTLAKVVVQRLVAPVLRTPRPTRLVCSEGSKIELTAQLAAHEVDVVFTDGPLTTNRRANISSELLAESDVALYASPALAARLSDGFPMTLDGAPLLLPPETASLRHSLDRWIASLGIRPVIAAELSDSALVKALASEGFGAFAAPLSVEEDLTRRYGVVRAGLLDGVHERLFAATMARRTAHPLVAVMLQHARAHAAPADARPDVA